jgi:hypothetical protein
MTSNSGIASVQTPATAIKPASGLSNDTPPSFAPPE